MQEKVLLYATAACPFCRQAEALLHAHGAQVEKVRVDLYPDQLQEMRERTGRKSVPQVFIGETHVGGHEDLVLLNREGRLGALINPRE